MDYIYHILSFYIPARIIEIHPISLPNRKHVAQANKKRKKGRKKSILPTFNISSGLISLAVVDVEYFLPKAEKRGGGTYYPSLQ